MRRKDKKLSNSRFKEDDKNSDVVTNNDIKMFNKIVKENYLKAVKMIKSKKNTSTQKKTFNYDLGEDTDTELPQDEGIVINIPNNQNINAQQPNQNFNANQDKGSNKKNAAISKKVCYDKVKYTGWKIGFHFK